MAAVILVALIVGGMWLARSPLSRINFAGSLGSGGRANVQAPPGFDIGVFAEGLNGPRFIAFGPIGLALLRGAGGDGAAQTAVVRSAAEPVAA